MGRESRAYQLCIGLQGSALDAVFDPGSERQEKGALCQVRRAPSLCGLLLPRVCLVGGLGGRLLEYPLHLFDTSGLLTHEL